MDSNDDQQVTITLPNGEKHYATGSPTIIYDELAAGREVVCGPAEYVLRLAPGAPFALRYDEAVT